MQLPQHIRENLVNPNKKGNDFLYNPLKADKIDWSCELRVKILGDSLSFICSDSRISRKKRLFFVSLISVAINWEEDYITSEVIPEIQFWCSLIPHEQPFPS